MSNPRRPRVTPPPTTPALVWRGVATVALGFGLGGSGCGGSVAPTGSADGSAASEPGGEAGPSPQEAGAVDEGDSDSSDGFDAPVGTAIPPLPPPLPVDDAGEDAGDGGYHGVIPPPLPPPPLPPVPPLPAPAPPLKAPPPDRGTLPTPG